MTTNEDKFPTSPTVEQRGIVLGTGCGSLAMAPVVLVVGAIILMILPEGAQTVAVLTILIVFLYCFVRAGYETLFGVADAVRVGNCPHCETEIMIKNTEGSALNCPGCRHRLILKDGLLHDTTG